MKKTSISKKNQWDIQLDWPTYGTPYSFALKNDGKNVLIFKEFLLKNNLKNPWTNNTQDGRVAPAYFSPNYKYLTNFCK